MAILSSPLSAPSAYTSTFHVMVPSLMARQSDVGLKHWKILVPQEDIVSGGPKTVKTPKNVALVQATVEQSPRRSARKHSLAWPMSNRSLRRILRYDLSFYPYKIMIVQELKPTDLENRRNCCQEMLNRIPEQSTFSSSDEAHFHLSGSVNEQNCRYWKKDNPRELHQRPLHSPKATVWCAVSKFGPYFFEEDGRSVTVNSQRYLAMLEDFFEPKLEELNEDTNLEDIWFQQYGATAHIAQVAMVELRRMFPARFVSQRGDVEWPSPSPDFSICDFFL
ncbi:hypothetical protein FHG87_014267 [Trinorchestia longiramus]|nr:hypothetical protein FHG87_014267 [Trinorchestia longiramus]